MVGQCLSPQVAVLDFSLDLPFSISSRLMLSPPALYSLILHFARLENWTHSYRQCQPVLTKGDPYNHDRVPKITWLWGPRDAHIYGCVNFYDTRHMVHFRPSLSPRPSLRVWCRDYEWMNEYDFWVLSHRQQANLGLWGYTKQSNIKGM